MSSLSLLAASGAAGVLGAALGWFLNNRLGARSLVAASIKADILAHHAGHTVLMIGHSNTVPELIQQLGAGTLPVIDESVFDNLFVVKLLGSGTASLTHLKYGKPS